MLLLGMGTLKGFSENPATEMELGEFGQAAQNQPALEQPRVI